jgi:hypothetical protein
LLALIASAWQKMKMLLSVFENALLKKYVAGFFKSFAVSSRVARWHIFKPKIPFWLISEDLAMEDVRIFYGRLVYFTAIWSILLSFGLFYCHLVYFMVIWSILLPFGIFYGYLVYFIAFWYILWLFGTFFPLWV